MSGSPTLRSSLWLLALACPGCGGGDDGTRETITPFGVRAGGAVSECNTMLLVVFDGVMLSDLEDLAHLPNLARLAASSVSFQTALTTQTSGNGALASVLTGLHSREHGIFSVNEPGRSALADEVVTLAERFAASGWRTAAAFPSKRHDRRISGFAQGFEAYEAPRVGQEDWSADVAVLNVRDVLAELGEDVLGDPGSRVFIAVGMQDAIDRSGELPDPTVLAPIVAEALEPYRAENARIDAALDVARMEPAMGLGKLKTVFARARGSGAAAAWYGAVRKARMMAIDTAMGELLTLLEESGRDDRALVVAVSLRGDGAEVPRREAGPSFAPEIVEVPLLVHRCGAGERRSVPGTRSLVDLARAIGDDLGLDVPASEFAGAPLLDSRSSRYASGAAKRAFVTDGRSSVHALRSNDLHVERHAGPEYVWFGANGRDALALDEIEDLAAADEIQAVLSRFAEPAELVIERGADVQSVEVAWSLSRGSALGAGSARARRVRGTTSLDERFVLPMSDRSASVALRVEGASRDALYLGSDRLDRLPVRYVPHGDAPSVDDDTPPELEFVRAPGRAWTLAVRGEGEATVTVGTWPPRAPTDPIEVEASTAAFEFVPGRTDLVRFTGSLPMDVLLKRRGSEEFAVSCERGGEYLPPTAMASDGSWYASETSFEFVVPSLEPGVSTALYSTFTPLPTDAIRIGRSGLGARGERPVALDSTALEYLRFLPAGE